jgi:hypothetical protein
MTGKKAFGCGDINLAACMLAMGVPPDHAGAVELIARDNGRDYVRFYFGEESPCGLYTPELLSHAWSHAQAFKAEHPGHAFGALMDFITERPPGCHSAEDWLSHASAFLSLPIDAARKTYRDIGKVCLASPESKVAYVCAFIRNRSDLLDAAKERQRKGHFKTMMDRGKSVSIIPAKAPKRIRDFLLSHIR